jgi:hypothetical protein
VGPARAAGRHAQSILTPLGIRHVVFVGPPVESGLFVPLFPDSFAYHVVELADTETATLLPALRSTLSAAKAAAAVGHAVLSGDVILAFDRAILQKSEGCLICDVTAISLAPALAIGCLMALHGCACVRIRAMFIESQRWLAVRACKLRGAKYCRDDAARP